LFDRTVSLRFFRASGASQFMISLHDDETTSVEAGRHVLDHVGGRLLELTHSGERKISFQYNGRTYTVDPNRMFLEAGIRRSLTDGLDSGVTVPDRVVEAVSTFADHLETAFEFGDRRRIVSLHNTMGDLDVTAYRPGNDHAGHAERVHVAGSKPPEDFFYVTRPEHFEHLQRSGFNVVLQDDEAVNDGSLSARAADLNRPYVNVEAKLGRLQTQQTMIRQVYDLQMVEP